MQGAVYVLDMGQRVWQFNTQESAGKVRFKAAEFVQSLVDERESQCETTVYGTSCKLHPRRRGPTDR